MHEQQERNIALCDSTREKRGGSGKTNGERKSTTVAVEGTENATAYS